MIVATALDRAYLEPACVFLASIARNGDLADARLVVYGLNLTKEDGDALRESCGPLAENLSIVDLAFAGQRLKALPVNWWVPSVAAYARLLIPDTLAGQADRLLYMDCDIVVNHSLRPLMDMPLDGAVVAAVNDSPAGAQNLIARRDILRLADPNIYFNSGVLLIDLDAWQKQKVSDSAFGFLASLKTAPYHLDQDALNAVLQNAWKPIDRTWNYFFESTDERRFDIEIYRAAAVLHFASMKPWFADCRHPAKSIYIENRQRTKFADKPLRTQRSERLRQFRHSPISTVRNFVNGALRKMQKH
jgi:lipopolysaccharide biosynthesis glycosyltransferase